MSNFSDDFDDDELTDPEKQRKNDIAQAKAKQGRFDGDDLEDLEDLPDSAVTESNRTSRD
ncbi:hypothetical protein [Psychrobacter sp.]|uniref:hypothetical protein n=1 Tax=Psychrobacter sp. TaxID=56811 RepID=UPI003BAE2C5D